MDNYIKQVLSQPQVFQIDSSNSEKYKEKTLVEEPRNNSMQNSVPDSPTEEEKEATLGALCLYKMSMQTKEPARV